jgi:hypothetical protein
MVGSNELREKSRGIRYIEEPTLLPCFQSVTQIWHFPSGDVLLEMRDRRDCLISDVDRIEVPVTGSRRIGEAVVLDTEVTIQVARKSGRRLLTEYDTEVNIQE